MKQLSQKFSRIIILYTILCACLISSADSVHSRFKVTSNMMVKSVIEKLKPFIAKSGDSVKLDMFMRQIWAENGQYTRNYIISCLGSLDDLDAVSARLIDNQDEVGDVIAPYLGKTLGNKLASQLKNQIVMATKYVSVAKMGDTKSMKMILESSKQNADSIVVFLSSALPTLNKHDAHERLSRYLDFTAEEVACRLNRDWVSDIIAYDNGQAQILVFADELSAAIIKQFPEKFSK